MFQNDSQVKNSKQLFQYLNKSFSLQVTRKGKFIFFLRTETYSQIFYVSSNEWSVLIIKQLSAAS